MLRAVKMMLWLLWVKLSTGQSTVISTHMHTQLCRWHKEKIFFLMGKLWTLGCIKILTYLFIFSTSLFPPWNNLIMQISNELLLSECTSPVQILHLWKVRGNPGLQKLKVDIGFFCGWPHSVNGVTSDQPSTMRNSIKTEFKAYLSLTIDYRLLQLDRLP